MMVKSEIKHSLSDEGKLSVINENGKRPNETSKNDTSKRLKTKSLYRQPTANELNRLQETENLFNSNLFRLQIEEILVEVKVKDMIVKKFRDWFADFKTYLLSIPEDNTEYDLTENTFRKQLKIKLPISSDHDKTKVMFRFYKFKDVEIVGSYSLNYSINSKLIIDLQITVPSWTYNKNDSINYKYHKKRAAYIAYVASHLSKSELVEELNYSFLNGCETKPIIEIKPIGKLLCGLAVHLNFVCEEDAFKLHRFSPSRNNLRESWLYSMENQESTSENGTPTPFYNNSILCDITAELNQKFVKAVLLHSEHLKQAVILLKIWIRQRNLQVSGYIISMIVAYFAQTRRVNNLMSSYQIVRNIWIALKSSEWDVKGLSLCRDENVPSIEEFHQHFPVVFIDRSGYYNICWQMSKGTYYAFRRECALAVETLDARHINSFTPLFMTPVRPLLQFDHILRFKDLPKVKESIVNKAPLSNRINYGLDHLSLATNTIYDLLVKGLGNRVDLILPVVNADYSWPVHRSMDKAKKEGYKEKLMFGFILNPENAMNVVDKGPPANMPEAEAFRAFWGDKSELRRFQDGSIMEACVWSAETLAERREICGQVMEYLLKSKYDISEEQLFHVCSQLSCLTARRAGGTQLEESSAAVLAAFDELRRDLRSLSQLPLDITAVYGISPVFSYCSPVPPLPAVMQRVPQRRGDACLIDENSDNIPEYIPVNKVVVELSHSGKWPGDLQAFRCLKAAFHLQIAERLKKQYTLPTQAYDTHVDVLKNGLVFRLQIAHPKELTLLRREVIGGVVKFKETQESIDLQMETVLLPKLRGALHGLQQRYPAFGPAACLLQRWLAAQLLAPQLPPLLADLLAAAVFIRPAPLAPAVSPLAAMLRALRLLADTDWTTEMMVLDFNNDLTKEDIADIERQFQQRTDEGPHMFIATSCDGALPSVWTKRSPIRRVVQRAQTLARVTLLYVDKAMLEACRDDILETFVPSLRGYDVLIHLKPEVVPYASERLSAEPCAPPQGSTAYLLPVVEFNPVLRYLHELKSIYEDFAVFFYDIYGGDVIAVLWKPDIDEPRDFQILNANALKPEVINGKTKYKVNIDAILEDFRILGEGLVKSVVLHTDEDTL